MAVPLTGTLQPPSDDASVLCAVCTGGSTGSKLVATVHVRLNSSLADVRAVLVNLASGGDGRGIVSTSDPVNITSRSAKDLMRAPLYPFELTASFVFVRGGGSRIIPRQCEEQLKVLQVLPRYPRFGAPSHPSWQLQPTIPTIVVPLVPCQRSSAEGHHGSLKRMVLRSAMTVIFVAQGSEALGVQTEGVMIERHQLHLQPLYGKLLNVSSWASLLTRWNANVPDFVGRTVLQEAAQLGNEAVLRHLLAQSFVNINARDGQGNTALHLAARTNRSVIVQLLVDAGADPLLDNMEGNTPLHIALVYRRALTVGLLCNRIRSKGIEAASLQQRVNTLGYSPLDLFERFSPPLLELCTDGNLTAVKALLHHYLFRREHILERDVLCFQTVVHAAAKGGNVEVLRYLILELQLFTQGEKELLDGRMETPLHIAAAEGHLDCVSFLVEHLPHLLGLQNINGDTPLLLALKRRRIRVVDFFLTRCPHGSVEPNAQDVHGLAALHIVCGLGLARAAEALLSYHNASATLSASLITDHRWDQRTRRNVHVVSASVTHHLQPRAPRAARLTAAVSAPTSPHASPPSFMWRCRNAMCGDTPLLCALIGGTRLNVIGVIELLLARDAVTSKEEGCMLLLFLLRHHKIDLADRFASSSPLMGDVCRENTLLCTLCSEKNSVGIRWCVKWRCGQLNSGTEGMNPLVVSAWVGDVDAIAYFLSHGGNPNALSGRASALSAAIAGGWTSVVRELILAGARLSSGGGEWCALSDAACKGLECVVRGLLGVPSLSAFDISHALVDVLQQTPGHAGRRRSAYEQICLCLARKYDPCQTTVHVTELLHLSASQGFFTVTQELVQGLLALPQAVLKDIIGQAPAPQNRIHRLIEPTMVPLRVRWKRLLPNKVTGKGGLYRKPPSFERLTLPKWSLGIREGVLRHRLHVRDVYSYAAAAQQKELLTLLLCDVRLAPWPGPDLRGWNACDYALEGAAAPETVCRLIAAGLVPLGRHGAHMPRTAMGPLLCAVYSTQGKRTVEAPVVGLLCKLVEFGDVDTLKRLLDDTCQHTGVDDLSHAAHTLDRVVVSCIRHKCRAALRLLLEVYRYPVSGELRSSTQPVLLAVFLGDMDALSCLLRAGSSPNAASLPERQMVPYMRCRGADQRPITPLCLAAWMHRFDAVALLTSATRGSRSEPLHKSTEDDVYGSLYALVHRRCTFPSEAHERLMADAVRMMSRAGQPYTSNRILRVAAARGYRHTVEALVECYGIPTLLADIVTDEVNSLHHLVSRSVFCPLLRSLLIPIESDAIGMAMSRPNMLLNTLRGARWSTVVQPVDYALSHNCAEGALLLLALGLSGTGMAPVVSSTSALTSRTRATLQHFQVTKDKYTNYTVLHSAVALGYEDVVHALTTEVRMLQPYGEAHPQGEACSDDDVGKGSLVFAPSMYGLAAAHCNGVKWFPQLEAVEASHRLAARDFFHFIYGRLSVTHKMDDLCRHPCNTDVFGELFSLDGQQVNRRLMAEAMQDSSTGLLMQGRTLLVTAVTPLTCAVVAGRLDWVQYIAFCSTEASSHRATVARLHTPRRSALAVTPPKRLIAGRRTRKGRRPMVHTCTSGSPYQFPTREAFHTDALCLSMALVAEDHYRRRAPLLTNRLHIFTHLLGLPGVLKKDTINPLAIAAAAMQRWDLVEAIIQQAKQLYGGASSERFFITLLNVEVPPFLRWIIGPARHMMHVAARCAGKDMIVTVARHSSRTDVEAACDANGNTAAFHVLHNPSRDALDTFTTLRIPLESPCCRKMNRTPLMVAAATGRTAILSLLLKSGQVNQKDRLGNTALMLAAAHGHLDVVELLLASGADASLRNLQGLTAVMVAAQSGHDHIALPLVQHFSRVQDLTSPHTTVLHCAAMGGCWRTMEAVVQMVENALAMILKEDNEGHTALYLAYSFGCARGFRALLLAITQAGNDVVAALDRLGACAVERQIIRCDSSLVHYGWLKGVLTVSEALAQAATGQPESAATWRTLRPGELVYAAQARPLRSEISQLLWCAKYNHAVGVRVLADYNVADDCEALHAAASRGHNDVVQLLLTLQMSDPNQRNGRGEYAFEVAAMAGHASCAAHLLTLTKPDPMFVLRELHGGPQYMHTMLHRLAPACGGTLLAPLVDVMSKTGPHVRALLYKEFQQPDESGLTPFEYTIAMGNPAAVLRTAQLIQLLGTTAVESNGCRSTDSSTGGVLTLSNAIFHHLPNLSPSVRTLLYDFFEMELVSQLVGFQKGKAGAFGRLCFSDVRLIGINALQRDAACAAVVSSVFTPEHERAALRKVLSDLPFKIRYEPESYSRATMTQQAQLLQWLGSSLMLSLYEGAESADLETVEIEVARRRSEFVLQVDSSSIRHSVYISGSHYLSFPDVNDALPSNRAGLCASITTQLSAMCQKATRALREIPHPACRRGTVRVEWDVQEMISGGASLRGHRQKVDCVLRRVCHVLQDVEYFMQHDMRDCVEETEEADLTKVVSEIKRVSPATVTCRWTHDDVSPYVSPHVMQGTATSTECVLLFNDVCTANAQQMLRSTLYRSLASDVVLVQVHHERDAFIHMMRTTLARANQRSTAGSRLPRSNRQSEAALSGGESGGEAIILQFKLELEGSALDTIPLHLLRGMLQDAAKATASLICPAPSSHMARFRSANLISDALVRRLRSVLVLHSTKRQATVQLRGDKLMLCFTPQLAPSSTEITEALRDAIVEEEIARCKRVLPDVLSALEQRLTAYLPSAQLIVDIAGMESQGDSEYLLSSLHLLLHNHSSLVVQPLVDGASFGWDTPLGSLMRSSIRQLTLRSTTSDNGTCEYRQEDGSVVYDCPLGYVQRDRCAASSWQLLTSQQVASLLVMQMAVHDASVAKMVAQTESFSCWTRVDRRCRQMTAGARHSFVVMTSNILNRRVASRGEAFTFVGPVKKVQVKDIGEGRYRVSFTAPIHAGSHLLYVQLRGQQIYNSPLLLMVRPALVHLDATRVLSSFNTVVAKQPFQLLLRLNDVYCNRLHCAPEKFTIVEEGIEPLLELLAWTLRGPDTVVVTLVVSKPSKQVCVSLRLGATGSAGVSSSVLTVPLECVDQATYKGICAWRRGLTLGTVPARSGSHQPSARTGQRTATSDRIKFYFRKSTRQADRARLKRDAAALGGVTRRIFPPREKHTKGIPAKSRQPPPPPCQGFRKRDTN